MKRYTIVREEEIVQCADKATGKIKLWHVSGNYAITDADGDVLLFDTDADCLEYCEGISDGEVVEENE